MHREVGGGACEAGVAEFLDYDRVVPKVSASTAKFFRNLRAKQAGLAAGTPKRPLDDACILPSLEIGCDFRRRKAPNGFPELVAPVYSYRRRLGSRVSASIDDGLERDLVAALEFQNLARLVSRRDVQSESFDDLSNLRYLVGI